MKASFGYVKANVLANEYIIRQDMNNTLETKKIKADLLHTSKTTINGKNISIVNNLFDTSSIGIVGINEENLNKAQGADEIWATISNQGLEKQSNSIIKDYNSRTLLIDNIVNVATKYNIKGITIHFDNIDDIQMLNRFILELAPRLREIGISTNIILTDKLNEADYVGIVDFVIEK